MTLVPAALVVLAACTTSDPGGSAPDESFVFPTGGKDIPTAPPTGLTIRGALSFDDIEGGCAFVETADGRRYEVVYPGGWTLDRRTGALTGPDGRAVPAGTTVEVVGTIATDRSSICQVGPIVVATRVTVPTP